MTITKMVRQNQAKAAVEIPNKKRSIADMPMFNMKPVASSRENDSNPLDQFKFAGNGSGVKRSNLDSATSNYKVQVYEPASSSARKQP